MEAWSRADHATRDSNMATERGNEHTMTCLCADTLSLSVVVDVPPSFLSSGSRSSELRSNKPLLWRRASAEMKEILLPYSRPNVNVNENGAPKFCVLFPGIQTTKQ
ncbi:hypothetical protein VZT92_017473 [Zoarces viviparus]|uniref:Uncharacterized protein n=1 Tax=Zoarces viviparus TaxID=48416 RepID=A0AAW1ESW1_ZOAVI